MAQDDFEEQSDPAAAASLNGDGRVAVIGYRVAAEDAATAAERQLRQTCLEPRWTSPEHRRKCCADLQQFRCDFLERGPVTFGGGRRGGAQRRTLRRADELVKRAAEGKKQESLMRDVLAHFTRRYPAALVQVASKGGDRLGVR